MRLDPNKEADKLKDFKERIHYFADDFDEAEHSLDAQQLERLRKEIMMLNQEFTRTIPSFRFKKGIGETDLQHLIDSQSEEELYEELERFYRMGEIHEKANDSRVARCEAKMAEVGKDKFMNLINNGEWSDYEGKTEIEIEYAKLAREQFNLAWRRKYGKPYKIEDDPNAKF